MLLNIFVSVFQCYNVLLLFSITLFYYYSVLYCFSIIIIQYYIVLLLSLLLLFSIILFYYYYYNYYHYSLIRAFHISVSRWFFTGVWVTASLLKSPGLFLVFWPFSTMLSFEWSPLIRQLPRPLVPLAIL